jgi:NTP pyrophosphatase (non-canonical NTP hydrolase)
MNNLIKKIVAFRDKRDWKQFHTSENLAKSILIEAAELLELYQWNSQEKSIDRVKDELADILIYVLLLADKYDLDIEKIILEKLNENESKYPINKAKGNSKKYNEFK